MVHFVFQSEELAERAHLAFGFTNATAPFTISAERVGAEYQVKFNYIGQPTYQPNQQLIVYYNGAPAGWLWLLPYMLSGAIRLGDKWEWGKWQQACPTTLTMLEGGTIPGLPIGIALERTQVKVSISIDQPYAEWIEPALVDVTFECRNQEGKIVYKNFLTDKVEDIDFGKDYMDIYIASEYYNWWDEGIVNVEGFAGVFDTIKWGDSTIGLDFNTEY